MKTYWTVVFRPRGSKTWTQVFNEYDVPHWTSERRAREIAAELDGIITHWVHAVGEKVPCEVRPAEVVVHSNIS